MEFGRFARRRRWWRVLFDAEGGDEELKFAHAPTVRLLQLHLPGLGLQQTLLSTKDADPARRDLKNSGWTIPLLNNFCLVRVNILTASPTAAAPLD